MKIFGFLCFAIVFALSAAEVRNYIVHVANLPNEDKSESNGPLDTTDPFMQVWNVRDGGLGDELYRTPTQDNTLHPTFTFTIDWIESEVYILSFRDHDALNPDDALGHVIIPAPFLAVGPVWNLTAPDSGATCVVLQTLA